MNFSRRTLLASVAPAAALTVAGCSNILGTGIGVAVGPTGAISVTLPPAITDAIQSAVNLAVKYIPTVESILATAAGLFGPSYATIVTAGSAALNAVISALVNIVAGQAPAAQARLHKKLRALAPGAVLSIGATGALPFAPSGVAVTGYRSN